MKKVAALILALMLLTLSVSALAEANYELIKGTLSDKGILGSPVVLPTEDYTGLFILYDFTDNSVVLCGRNASGSPEGCVWNDANPEMFIATLVFYLENFSDYTSNGETTPFAVGMTLSEDSDSIFAFDADTAAGYASTVRSVLTE